MNVKKLCSEPGCNLLVESPETRCPAHFKPKKVNAFEKATRANEYNTSAWRKLRKQHLKRHPHCVKCGSTEKLQVHHTVPPRGNESLFYDEYNLETVCATCHRVLTAKEIADRRRK